MENTKDNKIFFIVLGTLFLVTVLALSTFIVPTFAQSDGGAAQDAGQSANQTGEGMQQGANKTAEAIQGNASDIGSKITEAAKDVVGKIGEGLEGLTK